MKQNALFSILNSKINKGGGGGSTVDTDYNHLENKPSINGVGLVGDKSLDDLGIDIPTKESLGLDNVDNTSDLNKPISTATQTALDTINTDLTNVENATVVNLLPNTATSQTKNGIAFTVNTDKTITVNGTNNTGSTVYLKIGEREISGVHTLSGCPSGGSNETYYMEVDNNGGASIADARDFGNGKAYNYQSGINYCFYIGVFPGQTINKTFSPMLEKGTVKHAYQPYIGADSIPKAISTLNENLTALIARVTALES